MEKCRRMKRPQFCHRIVFFVDCESLEDTPAVLSLGKLCDEHGYSYEWINGQKPRLIEKGIRTQCNMETSHQSWFLTCHRALPQTFLFQHQCSPSTTVSSDSETRAREDLSGTDSHPAPVSSPNVEEIERGDPLCSDILEWLQEFRENLVDDRVLERGDSHASSCHEKSLEPMPSRSVDLGKHGAYTHFPADHKVLSDNCESRNNHRYAVVVQDLANQWIQAYPCKTKTSQETQRSLQKFLEPDRKPKVIYTDSSLELGKVCEDLSWNHCTSTPHRSETNGVAERAVRRVKEGTSAVLLQSGLNESWWTDSMECYTCLRNVTDLLSDGKTPYERRFWQPFKRPIIPFGSLVEYHPITPKDQSRIHQFGKKVLPGLFLGYALYAGGIWKGDVLVADIEELEAMNASEIYSKRLNAEEVIFQKKKDFVFPIADGRTKTLGGDQDLRTSTLIRQRNIQGDGHVDFLGESEGSLPQSQDSFPDVGEAINDFWSMSGHFTYRHHVEPRVKLYSPREESFPVPLKLHWRFQNHAHEFGCQARETHRWLLEYRWVTRLVRSLDRFHSICFIGRKTSRRIYVVPGGINEKTAYIQARSFMTGKNNGKKRHAEGKAKVVAWKAPSQIARDLFHWPGG